MENKEAIEQLERRNQELLLQIDDLKDLAKESFKTAEMFSKIIELFYSRFKDQLHNGDKLSCELASLLIDHGVSPEEPVFMKLDK